jgi:hypothetical protein
MWMRRDLCDFGYCREVDTHRTFANRRGKGLKPLVVSRFIEQGVETPCPQMQGFAKVLTHLGFIEIIWIAGMKEKHTFIVKSQ